MGRGFSIIDSSTWVATMTGLAWRRASSIARFWTIGTSSSGSSTPRSPRATMTPSNAAMICWRLSTACGFSILAMTGRRTPTSSITSYTSSRSEAERTNDSAIMSARSRRAQRRSSLSFSDRAGTETATPGRLMPLLLDTVPGTRTTVRTSVSVTSVASRATLPSSMSSMSPGLTSPGRPLYVVPTSCLSPSTSRVVMVKTSPSASSTGPSLKRAVRILGPCRSTRMPTAWPLSSLASRIWR